MLTPDPKKDKKKSIVTVSRSVTQLLTKKMLGTDKSKKVILQEPPKRCSYLKPKMSENFSNVS